MDKERPEKPGMKNFISAYNFFLAFLIIVLFASFLSFSPSFELAVAIPLISVPLLIISIFTLRACSWAPTQKKGFILSLINALFIMIGGLIELVLLQSIPNNPSDSFGFSAIPGLLGALGILLLFAPISLGLSLAAGSILVRKIKNESVS